MVKIQIKRGKKNNLPRLNVGEWGMTTDTNEIFLGGSSSNLQVATFGTNGKIPIANIDAYTKQQTLTQSTLTEYRLNTNSTPDDVFKETLKIIKKNKPSTFQNLITGRLI